MSFRHTFYYVIQAKRDIYDCTEIDADFADLLFTDPYVYRNPEFISNRVIQDDQHVLSIKLLFLCDMRQEYNEHFFGGNAPLAAEFFDRWWTLTKTDAAQDVSDVVSRIRPDDLSAICSQFSGEMIARLNGDW